jgi:putative ABC transport system ATP-binding protein
MTETPVLEMYGVVKEYPGHPPVRALGGVDLRVDRGELLAIVGPSGSGKSTLLHVMGTLDQPTSGTVRIAGVEVSGLSDRRLSGVRSRMIGFVFQQFHLLDGMSALENVATGLIYAGMSPSRRRRAARDSLVRVGLESRMHHVPSHLSGGERQRVAIARALVHRPEIVLADEPSGNLDTATSESIVALLKDLNEEDGSTIVVITHDHDLADALPRRVGIRDGLIEFDTALGLSEFSS